MNKREINVVDDFYPKPFGRNDKDGTIYHGENFRKQLLVPALKENDRVIVILDGYNRYAPSFIDEAFGGLIYSDGFTLKELESKLTIKHESLPSIVELAWSRIKKAATL